MEVAPSRRWAVSVSCGPKVEPPGSVHWPGRPSSSPAAQRRHRPEVDSVGQLGLVTVGRLPCHACATAGVAHGADPVQVDVVPEVDSARLARGRVAEAVGETATTRRAELLAEGQVLVDQIGTCGGVLVTPHRRGIDAVGADRHHDKALAGQFLAEVVVAAVAGDGAGAGDARPAEELLACGRVRVPVLGAFGGVTRCRCLPVRAGLVPAVQLDDEGPWRRPEIPRVVHDRADLDRLPRSRQPIGLVAEVVGDGGDVPRPWSRRCRGRGGHGTARQGLRHDEGRRGRGESAGSEHAAASCRGDAREVSMNGERCGCV